MNKRVIDELKKWLHEKCIHARSCREMYGTDRSYTEEMTFHAVIVQLQRLEDKECSVSLTEAGY